MVLKGHILRRLSGTSPMMKELVICIEVKMLSVKERVKI